MGLLVAAAVALSIVALVPGQAVAHLNDSDKTGSGRTDIWTVGMRMVRDRPVTGIGAGNFAETTVDYLLQPGVIQHDEYIIDLPKVAHNIYLQVLAELGGVGLALFLAILGFAVLTPLRAARNFAAAGRRSEELMARAVSIALCGFLAAMFFSSQLYSKAMWLMLAIGPAMLAVSERD
jgi:O-antigen ligase